MEELIIKALSDLNIPQLLATGGMIWFFYNRLDNKIDRLDVKIDRLEARLEDKIDRLTEKVEDIDRRLCRLEGSLATQGHCLFHAQNDQKAE